MVSKEIQTPLGPTTLTTTCVQDITIDDLTPMSFDFPTDITLSCDQVIGTHPSDLAQYNQYDAGGHPTTFYDEPIVEFDCEQVGINYEDELFHLCGFNSGSYKIKRTWIIANLCDKNSEIKHIQTIVVMDNSSPELFISDVVQEINSNSCEAYVEVIADYLDNCSEVAITNNSNFSQSGTAFNASGIYPKGRHTVNFIATDACGNVTEKTILVTVIDNKAPTVICRDVTIQMKSTGIVHVYADFLNAASHDNCTDNFNLDYEIQRVDQNDNPLGSPMNELEFTCADVGQPNFVRLWVSDAEGNQDYCIAEITIQDNRDFCPDNNLDHAEISGNILRSDGEMIGGVNVFLDSQYELTANGTYEINAETGMTHSVTANRSSNFLEGVTTWDIVQIRRHLLGNQLFANPYLHVAADINNDNRISTADILHLREAILGLASEFPNNQKSWRFIDANYNFPTNDPLSELFREDVTIFLMDHYYTADMVGVKIGDLSGDFNGRSSGSFPLMITLEKQNDQGSYKLLFNSVNKADLAALQFTLKFDPTILQYLSFEDGAIDLEEGLMNLNHEEKGLIAFSLDNPWTWSLNEKDELFSLDFHVDNTTDVLNAFKITADLVAPKAYTENGEIEMQISYNYESERKFSLIRQYPNPFFESTQIELDVHGSELLDLKVMDSNGAGVLEKSIKSIKGRNYINLDQDHFNASGIYYYEIRSGVEVIHGRLVYLKK